MQLDLNLLSALDALLEEGSVTGAAERLRLSAPAVSRTLGRIRRLTGDDILVRTGRTMTPTPYALAIREQVGELVRQAHAVLTPSRALDLAALDRTFTLQCHDALALSLGPELLNAVADQAPGVRLRLLAEPVADTDDLRHGRVDLQLGADPPELPEFRSETAGEDRLVVIMRRGHPGAGRLDAATYAAHPHVLISRRGRLTDPVDDLLAARGLHRRVPATVGTSATALHIVSRSDTLLTAPGRMCRPLIDAFGLHTEPLPVPSAPIPIVCTWHQRYDTDPAHAWLREQVRAALGHSSGTVSTPSR
ncbi:LysR family transcriptional regulator [Nucisporomicrobium flavum]|uniref:LysR family transcriptional regulator n=1 Tax=Nucisporomicrobium flavum TaxID=2785915 RepID=UPI0018F2F652|nr:LysR family transcriptional regulator [Nucisporomicrobium flavum]